MNDTEMIHLLVKWTYYSLSSNQHKAFLLFRHKLKFLLYKIQLFKTKRGNIIIINWYKREKKSTAAMHWTKTVLAIIPLLNGRLTECEGEYCCPEMKGTVCRFQKILLPSIRYGSYHMQRLKLCLVDW